MATINIRIDEELKEESEKILKELGFGMTAAVKLFLRAVVWHNGIPFSLEIPNKRTMKAFEEAELMASGKKKCKTYKSVEELMKDLGV